MRKIKKLVSDKALEYLRGANNYQFRDRISKVVGDCIDQLDEFSDILANVKDGKPGKDGRPGKDGKNGKDGVDGKDGKDGYTPYIENGYWYINGINTGVKADGSLEIVKLNDSYGTITNEQLEKIKNNRCVIEHDNHYYYNAYTDIHGSKYFNPIIIRTDDNICSYHFDIIFTTKIYTLVEEIDNRPIVKANTSPSTGEQSLELTSLKVGDTHYTVNNEICEELTIEEMEELINF